MLSIRCDRCDAKIEQEPLMHNIPLVFKETRIRKVLFKGERRNITEEHDLCDTCYEDLYRWLKGENSNQKTGGLKHEQQTSSADERTQETD